MCALVFSYISIWPVPRLDMRKSDSCTISAIMFYSPVTAVSNQRPVEIRSPRRSSRQSSRKVSITPYHITLLRIVSRLLPINRTRRPTCSDFIGAFLNDEPMNKTSNYLSPTEPYTINGKDDPTSQRFHVSLCICLLMR